VLVFQFLIREDMSESLDLITAQENKLPEKIASFSFQYWNCLSKVVQVGVHK
jgi:hypothetical protein